MAGNHCVVGEQLHRVMIEAAGFVLAGEEGDFYHAARAAMSIP